MVYGTTTRHSYINSFPAPVWALWKSFGIEEASMLGYWDKSCPVKTNHMNVKATVYVKNNKVLISIGNFDPEDQKIHLSFDWKALGMKPEQVNLTAPAIKNFQQQRSFNINDHIPVKSKKGWLLILSAE